MKKITRLFTFILFYFILSIRISAQGLEWVYTAGGAQSDGPEDIVVDNEGNVIAVGYFLDTVDFNLGGTPEVRTSAGSYDCFMTKHNAAGELLWCRTIGTPLFEICSSVDVDSENNIYIIGRYRGLMDFDPGDGVFEIAPAVDRAWFVLKLNSEGEFEHCISIDGDGEFHVNSVVVNESNDFIISGMFKETVDFDPSAGTYALSAEAFSSSLFIASYTSSGEFQWAKQIKETGILTTNALGVDNSNNVFLIGQFNGTVDFDPSGGVYEATVPFGIVNGYVVKFDEAGNFNWMKQLSGTSFNWYYGVAIDNFGDIYLSGGFEGDADFDPNAPTLLYSSSTAKHFAQKLSGLGNLIWAKVFNETDGTSIAQTISVDGIGNSFVGGYFFGDIDFNADAESEIKSSIHYSDGFVQKLDVNGNYIWAKTIGGEGFDKVTETFPSSDNSVFVYGTYQGIVNFNPEGIAENRSALGEDDLFLLKLSGTLSTPEHESLDDFTIYPNPFNSSITVTGDFNEIKDIRVFGLDGKVVFVQQGVLTNLMIDLSKLAAGTYILEIGTNQGLVRSQIVKY